jgi:hypothetical protein
MRNRLLLQRVFTIAQQSIGIRAERSNLSEFRFLKLLLNGWHELVMSRRQRRAILQAGQVLQSLLNRRSLVTAVSKWKSFSRKMKRFLIATIQQEKAVMQAAFLTWCIAMVNAKRLQSISVRKYTLHMQRRIFTTWKTLYTGKRAMAESFYLQRLKQKSVSGFKYYSRLVALDSIQTAFDMKRLQKLLQGWKLATIALIRIRRGLDLLSEAWLRLRAKYVLYIWPGRRSFRIAEGMRIHLTYMKPKRSQLVDIKTSVICIASEQVPSFIQPRQPSILERAMQYNYISDYQDKSSINRLIDVIQAVLDAWRIFINKKMDLVRRARIVKIRHNRNIQRVAMLNWMYLTPRTSHRIIIWTLPRYPIRIRKVVEGGFEDISSISPHTSIASLLHPNSSLNDSSRMEKMR